jgi:hypothetical protein
VIWTRPIQINIKDFGDNGNVALAERFGVDHRKENLPETILYTR